MWKVDWYLNQFTSISNIFESTFLFVTYTLRMKEDFMYYSKISVLNHNQEKLLKGKVFY